MNIVRISSASIAVPFIVLALLGCTDQPSPGPGESTATGSAPGWEKIYDRPADSATSIDILDDVFGLAVIGQTLQRTDDGGRSWQPIDTAPTDVGNVAIADRLHWWLFGTREEVMRTDDGGETWQPQQLGTEAPLNGFSAVNEQEAWITAYDAPLQGFPPHGDSAFLRTINGGATWTRVAIPGYGIYLGNWFVDEDDGWVLATQCHPGDPTGPPEGLATPSAPPCEDVETLLHTGNGGASWEIVATEPDFIPGDLQRIDRDRAFGRCAAPDCALQALYSTVDGGRTWSIRYEFDAYEVSGLRFASDRDGWVRLMKCGPPGGSCQFIISYERTRDGGQTWEPIEELSAMGRAFDATSSSVVAAVAGATGISYHDPVTHEWRPAATNAGPEPRQIVFISPEIGFASGDNGSRLFTEDGGRSWVTQEESGWWGVVPPGVLARWPFGGQIQLSTDDGRSWRNVPAPTQRSSGRVTAAAGDRLWVQLDGAPWRTYDAGTTWSRVTPFGNGDYHFIDERHGWFEPEARGATSEIIHLTANGGDTWEDIRLPHKASRLTFVDAMEGWGTTYDDPDCFCLIATRDGGRSWQTVSTAPWHIDVLVLTKRGGLWGLAALRSEASVIVTSADGGASWREDFRVQGAYPTGLVGREDRLWLYYSTTTMNLMDGGSDPPRRTVIYRRDVAP